MNHHVRRICTGLFATGLLAGVAAPATAATDPAVPLGCSAGTQGITAGGETVRYRYDGGVVSVEPLAIETPMPFQPTVGIGYGGLGDGTYYRSSELVLSPDGTVFDREVEGTLQADGTWLRTQTLTEVGSGYERAIDLSYSYPFVYQLNKWGAGVRYDLGHDGTASTLTNPTPLKWSLASQIRLLGTAGQRTEDLAGGTQRVWDVFYAVTRDGGLAQVEIAQDDASVYTFTVLRESGFKNVAQLTVGWCVADDGSAQQQMIMAVGKKGWTRVYYDADPRDGSGADLVGGDVIVTKDFDDVVFGS